MKQAGFSWIVMVGLVWMQGAMAEGTKFRAEVNVPCRAVTQGPLSHWFGYYDKEQFDPSGRYLLGMAVDFDDRPPTADDTIRIGMVDLHEQDRWIDLGETRAWGWQQGCMLQWVPGSASQIIYNDRRDGQFVAVIQDAFTGETRTLPQAIYALSPNGRYAVTTNFARLDETRPGYGYEGGKDAWGDQLHPAGDGIVRLDLKTGESKLILSLDQIAAFQPQETMEGAKHWFNHLLVNPAGNRFIFLHRWEPVKKEGPRWRTRMFTANLDGSDISCLADHDMVSHFIWKNPTQILAYTREPESGDQYHLYTDQSDTVDIVGGEVFTRDGHCTISPDGRWMLTDTYPDQERMQTLMLYNLERKELVILGRFYMDTHFKDQSRCDLHGRWSRDGQRVCIDSLHSGQRQMYLLDVSRIVR